jgi:UDP-glucuronate decarboxylase
VDDLIDGFLRFMDTPDEITGPMNLGNPGEFTIAELADLVLDITGSKSELVREPLPGDDPTQRCPDIGLARRTLGWEPKIPLREGLTKTIEYFEEVVRRG